jgi:hypothetical protein
MVLSPSLCRRRSRARGYRETPYSTVHKSTVHSTDSERKEREFIWKPFLLRDSVPGAGISIVTRLED